MAISTSATCTSTVAGGTGTTTGSTTAGATSTLRLCSQLSSFLPRLIRGSFVYPELAQAISVVVHSTRRAFFLSHLFLLTEQHTFYYREILSPIKSLRVF